MSKLKREHPTIINGSIRKHNTYNIWEFVIEPRHRKEANVHIYWSRL